MLPNQMRRVREWPLSVQRIFHDSIRFESQLSGFRSKTMTRVWRVRGSLCEVHLPAFGRILLLVIYLVVDELLHVWVCDARPRAPPSFRSEVECVSKRQDLKTEHEFQYRIQKSQSELD